jgi:1,4-alpha-glucan branching enzyme
MKSVTPSSYTGMGAVPFQGGIAFRVWAPHAEKVYVTGTFNNWSKNNNPLAKEPDGYWSVDVPGATIGDQYRYLIANGSKTISRLDPYAREVTHSNGNSIIHDPDFEWKTVGFEIAPLHELVIYELHVGTFNDPSEVLPGNFNKAIEKLPYLRDLGVNAIEVMPAMEFRGGFSWGYNPALIFAIESEYGGPAAFKKFVRSAHENDLAVIFDVVYNHFGPGDLSLWQFDGWNQNNKGGIYFYNDRRSQTPWGDTRPDYGRPEVRHYIKDNALMWMEEFQIDGLRWDATAYIRNIYGNDNDPDNDIIDGWSLMQWINQEIKRQWPHKICIAEDLRNNPYITKAVQNAGAGFDTQWNARFSHRVREVLLAPEDKARNLNLIREAVEQRFDGAAFNRVIYTESHDEVANGKARVPEEISPGDADTWLAKKLSTLGAALTFTSPGVPMIFQGQEFLEDDWFRDKDPIDWSKKEKYQGILNLYQDLIRLRRNLNGHTQGLCGENIMIHHCNHQDKILAFHRWDTGKPGDSVIVVVNLSNKGYPEYQIGFPHPGSWNVRFNSDWSGYDPSFSNHPSNETQADRKGRDEMPSAGFVSIGPYSVVVLSQTP